MSFNAAHWIRQTVHGLTALATISVLACPLVASAGDVRFEGEGHTENPVWSANGKFLAFEVNRFAGDIDMYFAEVSGDIAKDAVKVKLPGSGSGFGSSGQVVINAAWHPDGLAVFEGSNQGGQFRLYFMAPGGASAAEMLNTGKAPGDLTFPAISPDGNKLAFISDQTGNGDVQTWDRSTDQMSRLTSTDGTESFPSYSPDGSQVLFTRKVDSASDVFLADIASGTESAVATGAGDQTRPVFGENDSILYFASGTVEQTWDLELLESVGGNRKTLAHGIRLPTRARPAVSPDRKWVAFAYDDPTKASKIVLMRVDGSATVDIDTSYVACGEPALGLQGGRVLLAFTSLPSASADWRFLTVIDVTDKL